MFSRHRIVTAVVLAASMSVAGMGQANRLRDLVNIRASSGESELESRGYSLTHTTKGDDRVWGYWWNPSSKNCICVATMDGRFSSITDTLPGDCNQKEKSGGNTGAKVGAGVAAAAIIGAIVLAHKSNNHSDNKHYEDPNQEAEYERGYRDGLYNSTYHNYSNTDYYRKGYEEGVDQRRRETSYSTGQGGYRPHVNLRDLVGIRASSGESEMQSRGFRNVNTLKAGEDVYSTWFNRETRQCVQVTIVDGRYNSIDEMQKPECRDNSRPSRVDPNEADGSARSDYDPSSRRGRSRPVDVSDLVGARASSGESEFQARGFRNVDVLRSGNTSYTIWYNTDTRQCIQAATVNGRYDSVTDIQSHAKCR